MTLRRTLSTLALTLVVATIGAAAPSVQPPTSTLRLAPAGERGDKLIFTGRITDIAGKPLPGATLQLYHADAMGDYARSGATAPRLSGTLRVGADGAFRVQTIVPSQIRNQEGGLPHIHGSAVVPGRAPAGFVINLTLARGRHLNARQKAASGLPRSMARWIYQDPLGTWWLVYDPVIP